MKKLVLQRAIAPIAQEGPKRYRIAYDAELNAEQLDAVMHDRGPALVIAGAGTGKTRVLVYRVARLVEDGIPPQQILLLTFTRKAAQEMMQRASALIDDRCNAIQGGTFHSYANLLLRRNAPLVGLERNYTILDQSDSEDALNLVKAALGYDKVKRRIPQKNILQDIYSASVNRCETVESVVIRSYNQFVNEIDTFMKIFREYVDFKRRRNMVDYDDLLVHLGSLIERPGSIAGLSDVRHVLVDEYQDTNRLQGKIVEGLFTKTQNVMAVGDEAQSIYSFRGAEFRNILEFEAIFSGTKRIELRKNYRSTRQILGLAKEVIDRNPFGYKKELEAFADGDIPMLVACKDDRQQSQLVVEYVLNARDEGTELADMAVLFRSGYMSFDLEIELTKANIPFRKFGGLRFAETAHIKDLIAFFRVIDNPQDEVSWHRILVLLEGVGTKTATQVVEAIISAPKPFSFALTESFGRKRSSIDELLEMLRSIRPETVPVSTKADRVYKFYKPLMTKKFDDHAKRQKDIDTFLSIVDRYNSIQEFLTDTALNNPTEALDPEAELNESEYLTLSTIHSAKGLEWRHVHLIGALDGRFPPTKSLDTIESLEEERRLAYVAITRAKERLMISFPTAFFERETGFVLSNPSRFFDGIGEDYLQRFKIAQEPD